MHSTKYALSLANICLLAQLLLFWVQPQESRQALLPADQPSCQHWSTVADLSCSQLHDSWLFTATGLNLSLAAGIVTAEQEILSICACASLQKMQPQEAVLHRCKQIIVLWGDFNRFPTELLQPHISNALRGQPPNVQKLNCLLLRFNAFFTGIGGRLEALTFELLL